MAEITKVTTPMVPKENIGSKLRPVSDQAFELTDPSKVHRSAQEGKIADRQPEQAGAHLKESLGRAAIMPLLKNAGDIIQAFKKIAFLVEMGVSASDVANDAQVKELLESLFVSSDKFLGTLLEQDKASVLFKGTVFDILRDILGKFEEVPRVRDAIANLLKAFDHNVNSQNSVKTILYNCSSILDYMFAQDRAQFADYLSGLAQMLLPKEEAAKIMAQVNPEQMAEQAGEAPDGTQKTAEQQQAADTAKAAGTEDAAKAADQAQQAAKGEQAAGQTAKGEQTAQQAAKGGQAPPPEQMSQKEAAQVLKNNLLPLLGEIVTKYHQNTHIRDVVMVVIHNIVRVDQGTPEALKEAVEKLLAELKQVANVPENFEKNLLDSVKSSAEQAKNTPNNVISRLADIISETLRSPEANPAIVKQAEGMLISMLQNQGSIMDVLHFMLPLETPLGKVFTELYVDPEAGETAGGRQGKSRKIFLSIDSETHGSFELSFLETNERVDFALWCPDDLVKPLSGLKRHFADIMQTHGYMMNNFAIDTMREPHSVAEVFPRLLNKRVGIDVQI